MPFADPAKKAAYGRKYYRSRRSELLAAASTNYRLDAPRQKELSRRRRLKLKFGLSVEEYDEMLKQQGGGCAVCKREPSKNRRLAVDHDHTTGKVRALLCFGCNIGLGKFKDDIALLRAALEYLEAHDVR